MVLKNRSGSLRGKTKMNNLSIKVIDRRSRKMNKTFYIIGRIFINDFYENIEMPVRYWEAEDYERQWKEGLERLKYHDRSCLVAQIYDPHKGLYIDWWLLYKEGSKIFIRNEVLFRQYYEEIIGDKPFTVETCYDFIRSKEPRLVEDGDV